MSVGPGTRRWMRWSVVAKVKMTTGGLCCVTTAEGASHEFRSHRLIFKLSSSPQDRVDVDHRLIRLVERTPRDSRGPLNCR